MQIMARQAGEGKRACHENRIREGKSMRMFRSFVLPGAAHGVLVTGIAAAETTYIEAGRMIDVADGDGSAVRYRQLPPQPVQA